MPKLRESTFTRHKGFWYERAAGTPWRLRIRKAAMYAGLIWLVLLIGMLLLKYVFGLIDKPIMTLLAQSAILPLLLFGVFVYCYRSADETKQLYAQKDSKDENA